MTHESSNNGSSRLKFIIGGALFITAVIFMIISATRATAEFFMTVREVHESEEDLTGQNLRVSGAVIGESIVFDPEAGMLTFTIAHIPGDEDEIEARGGLSFVLHQAVNDPDLPHLVVMHEGPPPDMLRDEAQAILTGTLQADGTFLAEEILLKCPSKYEEAVPEQVGE
jgi:cytochrome c-type biogenesis protein CcmE